MNHEALFDMNLLSSRRKQQRKIGVFLIFSYVFVNIVFAPDRTSPEFSFYLITTLFLLSLILPFIVYRHLKYGLSQSVLILSGSSLLLIPTLLYLIVKAGLVHPLMEFLVAPETTGLKGLNAVVFFCLAMFLLLGRLYFISKKIEREASLSN